MQIESLKMFCDLAETKRFTKAAQVLMKASRATGRSIATV